MTADARPTSANMSTKLEEIQASLEELQTLDDIVADLETMSKEVEKVEQAESFVVL